MLFDIPDLKCVSFKGFTDWNAKFRDCGTPVRLTLQSVFDAPVCGNTCIYSQPLPEKYLLGLYGFVNNLDRLLTL